MACGLLKYICLICLQATAISASVTSGVNENGHVSAHALSGIQLWLIQLFNGNRILFSIIVTVIIGLFGISIGFITDLFLKLFGFEISKINHHE